MPLKYWLNCYVNYFLRQKTISHITFFLYVKLFICPEPGWNSWTNPNATASQTPPNSANSPDLSTGPSTLNQRPFHQNRSHSQQQHQQHPQHPPKGFNNRGGAYNWPQQQSQQFQPHGPKNAGGNKLQQQQPPPSEDVPGYDTPTPLHTGGNATETLDAAKRKTLPTWIRLGLEKMEREKQRQAEAEERERLRLEQLAEQAAHVQELLNDGVLVASAANSKSKFVSIRTQDQNGVECNERSSCMQDSDQSSDDEADEADASEKDTVRPVEPPKSRAERLQQLVSL